MTIKHTKKKQKLRNNEYYDFQEIQDELYAESKNGYRFRKLYDIIISEQNILLAFRNIKKNTGGKTAGVDDKTIEYLENMTKEQIVKHVRNRLSNYSPHEVRRVEIPKENGKTRPLGIPTISDRLIQQCIKQVLEPICEAKFYNHSYGFRPNRSTKHAIARTYSLINKNKLHYVVDIDIKGFFDNVNHGKLIKQMWTLGIQDKKLISIISKMLKAPVKGEGIPTKGTPQGGILSPLLSNIVLNELDWWIANQWEFIKTEYDFGNKHNSQVHKFTSLRRKSNLKEIFIVRYADDFKIFCRDYKTAQKAFKATTMWLKERLHLDISPEKSKVVNLKTNYSEFLGFKLKARKKGKKLVVTSHMTDKAKKKVKEKLKDKIKKIKRNTTMENTNKLNSAILGVHNYYNCATLVSKDFDEIAYEVNKNLYNRLKAVSSKTGKISKCFAKYYGKYNYKRIFICNVGIFPISGIKHKNPMNFTQKICNYTEQGRILIHKKQKQVDENLLRQLMENPIYGQSVEYNDNRQSLYVAQKGLCAITGEPLHIGNIECHHKKPRKDGGTDEYSNLILVNTDVHKLIHATVAETIEKYKTLLQLEEKQLQKLNKLRSLVGNDEI